MVVGTRIRAGGSAAAGRGPGAGEHREPVRGAGKGAAVLRDERPDAAQVFAGLPPARPDDEGLRESIRALRAADDLLLGVIDDDPTGSQAVHGVQVVTVLDEDAYAAALAGPAATCFVLTNSRSLDEPEAVGVTTRAARGLITVAGRRGTRIQLISRSDSTLRGHVMAEVAALQAVRHDQVGRGYNGVLLVPAFLEAGRVTAADIHWARTPAGLVPVGETEFAQDSAFGYSASDLRVFVAEKSGGRIRPEEVRSISLADIRLPGMAGWEMLEIVRADVRLRRPHRNHRRWPGGRSENLPVMQAPARRRYSRRPRLPRSVPCASAVSLPGVTTSRPSAAQPG